MTQQPQLTRRNLLRLGTLAASGCLTTRFQPAMAGPFTTADFNALVPADKKLSVDWLRSLYSRGVPEWFSGTDLEHIGMPIGGICCGQVYLAGDGRLWHWDIFNQGVKTNSGGSHYAKPMAVTSAVDLGFSIRVRKGGKEVVRAIDRTGFPQLRFRGAYPIGFVDFNDDVFPVKISLEAFSPFVPLDVDASSLPLTVMRYTLHNDSKEAVEFALAGALRNPVLLHSGNAGGINLVNTIVKQKAATCLHCTAEKVTATAVEKSRPNIVFSDHAGARPAPLDERRDMGDVALAILDRGAGVFSSAGTADFTAGGTTARSNSGGRPKGMVGKSLTLAPGEQACVSFAVAWRFPNQTSPVSQVPDKGHYYAERFPSSLAVVEHHAADHAKSYARTRLWHDTWYDSTLPHWLLDRAFINVSTLATSTSLRMEGGRFWGWEGVGCCPGTCSHVWHYAQSIGRVFPELERITRERIDYGLAYQPDGRIFYRAESGKREAIDGQCGTILRVLREHTMSTDDAFLRRIWPRVKGSIEYLIKQDGDGNGVLEGEQYNTLDASWYGPISWISSLYLAALRAGAVMAKEMGDESFARDCNDLANRGGKWLSENLFDGEFFYQDRDPKHPGAIGSGIGCEIDQVFGQGWAHQLALGRVLPVDKTVTALKSLWRYNFTPDVGPYRKHYKTGRWYAMPGEAGLLMCTFPKGGEKEARGSKPGHGFAGYFNECMNGFEYQAAGHMVAEGLVEEGLAMTRAIHDRYHPSRRNPYNEIECGDHYARSMASHGVFVSVCGFECHGPKKHIGFAPKITPENFKAPFIAADGWGAFSQRIESGKMIAEIEVRRGCLPLKTIALEHSGGSKVSVKLGDATLLATMERTGKRVFITLASPTGIQAGAKLIVSIS